MGDEVQFELVDVPELHADDDKNMQMHNVEYVEEVDDGKSSSENSSDESGASDKKKKRRCKPGVQALREIYRMQKTYDPILKQKPFKRLVKQITASVVAQSYESVDKINWQADAMHALLYASDHFLINVLQEAQNAAIHRGVEGITEKDLLYGARHFMDDYTLKELVPKAKKEILEAQLADKSDAQNAKHKAIKTVVGFENQPKPIIDDHPEENNNNV